MDKLRGKIPRFLDAIRCVRAKAGVPDTPEGLKLAGLSDMSASIAHEINNPLLVLNACVFHLKSVAPALPELERQEVLRVAGKITEAGERIHRVVKSARQLGREDVRDPIVRASVAEIIHSARNICILRHDVQGIEMRFSSMPDTAQIICRPVQIAQILLILLNNAFDAVADALKSDHWVEISCKETKDNIEIYVTDSGAGIRTDSREKLFHPFFTTKAPGKGLGVGLSLARGFARQHGGDLSFDENHPHTRFILRLPLAPG